MAEFTVTNLAAPLDDWTGSRIIIRSKDCPGGVAAIIGGAEEYANLIEAAPDMHEALIRLLPHAVAARHEEHPDILFAADAIAKAERK